MYIIRIQQSRLYRHSAVCFFPISFFQFLFWFCIFVFFYFYNFIKFLVLLKVLTVQNYLLEESYDQQFLPNLLTHQSVCSIHFRYHTSSSRKSSICNYSSFKCYNLNITIELTVQQIMINQPLMKNKSRPEKRKENESLRSNYQKMVIHWHVNYKLEC